MTKHALFTPPYGTVPESGPPGKTRMSRPRWPVVWLLVLLGALSVCAPGSWKEKESSLYKRT